MSANKSLTSSLPGGLFGTAPEPQYRARLDGVRDETGVRGRGNASSIKGGLFGSDEPANALQNRGRQVAPSAYDGAAGGKSNGNSQFLDGHFRGGTAKDGIRAPPPFAWEDAAGGKSNNASQVQNGHFRGGTRGSMGSHRGSAQAEPDDFLERLSQAEQADDEHERYLAELLRASENEDMARQAAAQIAEENGLGPQEQQQLERQIFANLRRRMAEAAAEAAEAATYEPQHATYQMQPMQNAMHGYPSPQADPSPPHGLARQPGFSPRVSSKPTAATPSSSGAPLRMAAGGYRQAAASFDPNKSSIVGGIFG